MSTYSHALPVGAVLHGGAYDYVIMRVLGQGTFGITYLAKVRMTGRLGSLDSEMRVCVKEFFMRDFNGRSELTVTTGSKEGSFSYYKERFTKEARSLSKLEHPGIVRVVDLFEGNNTAYYVMEYLDGGSLDKLISEKRGLSLAEALPLIRQIAEALDYMHSKRMLHLDLKPLNVMLDKAGKTVLIDFGLAKQFNENGEPESSTSIGQGTPGYAPIEQATYKHGDGFPTTIDIYALGATFYKMLSGHRPPNASDIFNEGFECVDFSAPAFTSQVAEVIQRAMSPKKKARYQTAKEFLAALRTIDCEEEAIEAELEEETTTNIDDEVKTEELNNERIEEIRVDSRPITPRGVKKKGERNSKERWRKDWPGIALIVAVFLCLGGFAIESYNSSDNSAPKEAAKKEQDSDSNKELPFSQADGEINDHGYVDLGLPSGLKWATCNVGAFAPFENGHYYAWGEVSPKETYTEESITSPACESSTPMSGNPIWDAACANWGSPWRIPTSAELEELYDNCTWTPINQGGHNGFKATGPNGNSIFFPASGYMVGTSLQDNGKHGAYLSFDSNDDKIHALIITNDETVRNEVNIGFANITYWGNSVRPVAAY